MDTFCVDCNCPRVPPGAFVEVDVKPPEMARHVRVVECGRCKASVIDHLPEPLSPELAKATVDFHARYWGEATKPTDVIEDYGAIYWTPAYAHIRPMVLEEIERARTVLDFGAGPGSLLHFLRKEAPHVLGRIDYVGVEPTAAFRPALEAACAGVRHRIVNRHLTLETIPLFPRADLFIATGTFVYIEPAIVQAFFDATDFEALIVRDYFGNDGMEPGRIMYNPTFPMFAHAWRSVLRKYRIELSEPSIGGPSDGFGWRAVRAKHL